MRTSLLLALIFVLCSQFASAQIICTSLTNCTSCLSGTSCVWCGQENKCAISAQNCIVSNVTTYTTYAAATRPMISCLSGVATSVNQCPSFTVSIVREFADSAFSMVAPIRTQPILQIIDNHQQQQQPNNDPFYVDVVGTYFTQVPEAEKHPKFFSLYYFAWKSDSYLFDKPAVQTLTTNSSSGVLTHEYLFSKNVSFADLAIVGDTGSYRVGFVVARVSLVSSSPSAVALHNSQCAFVISEQDISITPEYQNIYLGTQLLLGLPVLIIGVTLATVAAFRCKHAFKNPHEEKKEQTEQQLQNDTTTATASQHNRRPDSASFGLLHNTDDATAEIEINDDEDSLPISPSSAETDTSTPQISVPTKARGEANEKTLSSSVGGRPPYKKLMLALVNQSDADLIKKSGTDVYFFLWFQKLTIAYMLICAAMSFLVLLPINRLTDAYSTYFFEDFAATTMATIALATPASLMATTPVNPGDEAFIADSYQSGWFTVHIGVICAFLLLGCVYIWRILKLGRIIVKSDKNYSSMFTVQVKGLSSDIIDPRDLREHFVEQYGAENVISVHIAWDLEHLVYAVKRREEHQKQLTDAQQQLERTGVRATCKEAWYKTVKYDAIEYHTKRLASLDAFIREYKNPESVAGSGIGFVTFATPELARKCIDDYGSLWFQIKSFFAAKFMESSSWAVSTAPEVHDVCWENLGYTRFNRACRSIAINIGLIVLLFVIYTITFLTSIYHYWRVQYGAEYAGFNAIFMLVLDLIPELISVVNEIVAPTIGAVCRYEKHQTRNTYINAYLRRIILFMLLNTLVIPRIWSTAMGQKVADSQAPFNTYHYLFNTTGSEMVKYLIAQAFIAKGLELFFIFLGMMIEYKVSKKITRPEFDYGTNYGIRISVMFALIVWGALVPMVFLPGLAYFFITYFVDKWLIMHLYERGRESDGAILYQVSGNIGTYLMLIPIAMAILLSRNVGWQTVCLAIFGTFVLWMLFRRLNYYGDMIRNQTVAVNASEDSAVSSSSASTGGSRFAGGGRGFFSRIRDAVTGKDSSLIPNVRGVVDRKVLAKQYEHPYRRYTSL